jgi:Mce-associated membrane protein
VTRPAGRDRGRWLLVGLAVLAVAAAVVVGQLARAAVVAGETDAAARDGAAAAAALTPVLLGYDWRTVDADAERIDAVTTGPFAAQNRAIVLGLVVPAAVEGHASSSATVSGVGVVTAAPDHVETVVLYTQTTTRDGNPAPRRDARSARVVLEPSPDDGRWLVAGFDAL